MAKEQPGLDLPCHGYDMDKIWMRATIFRTGELLGNSWYCNRI